MVTILVAASVEGEKLPITVLCIGKIKLPRWTVVIGKRADSSRRV